jgi:primosomal protein N' (replication factor Y)
VVLDAHDEAYREQRAPTWSAVDVVAERAGRDGAPLVLVSPCPPVALAEGARPVGIARPLERRGWPVVEVVDRTADDPRTGLVSERLAGLLRTVLERPEGRIVCILNRTGRIRLLGCVACGSLARCTRCGGAMAQPAAAGTLECRRCGETRPTVCAECDSTRFRSLRIGVGRATEELSALTGTEAAEVTGGSAPDAPVTSRLVVGTEAALHRIGRADAVAFLDFDQHLLAPRYLAGEQALALLARASRLVGTRERGGRVLVQTRVPRHEVLRAAERADPGLLADSERAVRRELGLPPFGALGELSGPGAVVFGERLMELPGVGVSPLDHDRWLVRASDHRSLCDALAGTERPAERVRVVVDPEDV